MHLVGGGRRVRCAEAGAETATFTLPAPDTEYAGFVATGLFVVIAVAALLRGSFKSLRKKKSTRVNLTVNRDKHDA